VSFYSRFIYFLSLFIAHTLYLLSDVTTPEFVVNVALWRLRKKKKAKMKKEHTFLQPSLEHWIEDGWLECDTPNPSKPRKSIHLTIQYMVTTKILIQTLM